MQLFRGRKAWGLVWPQVRIGQCWRVMRRGAGAARGAEGDHRKKAAHNDSLLDECWRLAETEVFLELHGNFRSSFDGDGWGDLQFALDNALAAPVDGRSDVAGGLLFDGRRKTGLIPSHTGAPTFRRA